MAEKKKPGKVLVKVSKLDEERLDKALDRTLDALFGPDDEEVPEETPAANDKTAEKRKSVRPRRDT